jgi:hypothetical protein
LGQARWGSLRSWQFGHSESDFAFKASWARRVAVRCCECRRFGLGIGSSYLIVGQRPHKVFNSLVYREFPLKRSSVDRLPVPRKSISLCSDSFHSVRKALCNLPCKWFLEAQPAESAL